jgi:DNA invertase Pin-like site-specific DNA recombinase
MSAPVRAATYYRMSDDRQEDSIDRQKSQLIPYAEKHGYVIVRDYTDEGISGDVITKRKEFQRLLRDAQAGLFDCILCDDKDRFGRFDSIDSGEIVAPLRRKGVWLETVAQGRVDWESFAGRMSDAILQEAKLIEQAAISRRVLSGQLMRARRGQDTGGRPLYGYRREPDAERVCRLVPDDRKAEAVRLIFKLYDQGETLCAIAQELYQRGIPSPRGQTHWTRSVLHRLLKNRRYTGDWTWGVHASGKRHRYAKDALRETRRAEKTQDTNPLDAWVVIPDTHEPLVDREAFERVQARLRGNKARTTPIPGGGGFALSKMLVCGHCGCSLTGITFRGRREYLCRGYIAYGRTYCTRNTVAEKPLVNVLIRKLQQTFLDPDRLQELRAEMVALEKARRSDGNLGRLRKRCAELERQIDRGNGNLAILPADRLPGVVAKIREWERELESVRAEVKRAETESPVKQLEERIASAEAALWRLQEALRDEDLPLLREVLRQMVSRVELHWTRRAAGRVTRCRLDRGVVYLRASEEPSQLYQSADR